MTAPPTVLHAMADWGIPSERFVVDLMRGLTTTRPVVVCGRRHPVADPPAVPVHAVLRLLPRRPEAALRRPIRAVIAAYAVAHRAQLLHAHFGYYAAHAAAVARRLRRPWLVSLHGYDLLVMASEDPELHRVITADAVVVPSEFLARAAVDRGFPADRIHVIPSGVRINDYPFRERRPAESGAVTVTFAGRFVEKKGVLDAARAMRAATLRHPQLRCRFVGYGPLEGALRAELARLDLDATIVDGRSPGAVATALIETDLVLTPSRTAVDGDAESLGLVNIEAQACGVPVVSTRHGGIPEAVAADAGILVPERDDAALTAALVDLVDHPERWPAMGRAGRAHVERRFALADRVRDVEQLYAVLLEQRPARLTGR
jgi:colanic acid/amylovoran biosynthesis glycosyltransferase